MKRFFKVLGIAALIVTAIVVAVSVLFVSIFCGGHPHGLC